MKYLIIIPLFITSLIANELNDLIDIALQNNSNIIIQKSNIDNKDAGITEARAGYLPNLSLNADISNYDIKTSGVRTDGDAKGYTVTANQLIYDFGKTYQQIASSKSSYNASLKELITTTSSTVLDVKKAYYDILNKYQLIEVAQESVKIDELQLNQASEYLKAGIKTKIDVTNAQLQLSNSNLDLLKSNYDLKISKTKLITILGESNIRDVKKDTQDIMKLSKNVKGTHYNIEDLIAEALKNRPEIEMYKFLIDSSFQQYKSVQSSYYPTLNLSGSYQDSQSDDIASLDVKQGSIGVYLKWDFFSGFRTKANTKQALTSLQTVKEQLKQQELTITADVTTAYYNLKQSVDSLKISLLNVDLAEQNLELSQERYKNGLNDIVELNNSKLDFINAKNNLVNTYYTYKTSMASLDYTLGVIYTEMN